MYFYYGCAPNNTNGKLFESFYIGKGNSQYFIKPLDFKNADKSKVSVDITLRTSKTPGKTVTINLSFFSDTENFTIDSIIFIGDSSKIQLEEVEPLFYEKRNNSFLSRYTSTFNYEKFIEHFSANNMSFMIYNSKGRVEYKSTTKTRKKVRYINQYLLKFL